jgi:hypothetical protein
MARERSFFWRASADAIRPSTRRPMRFKGWTYCVSAQSVTLRSLFDRQSVKPRGFGGGAPESMGIRGRDSFPLPCTLPEDEDSRPKRRSRFNAFLSKRRSQNAMQDAAYEGKRAKTLKKIGLSFSVSYDTVVDLVGGTFFMYKFTRDIKRVLAIIKTWSPCYYWTR